MRAALLLGSLLAVLGPAVGAQASDIAWYAGGKAGLMLATESGFESGWSAGVVGGCRFLELDVMGYPVQVAVEAEAVTSLVNGEIDFGVGPKAEWDHTAFIGYAVARTAGELYAKVKVGALYERIVVRLGGMDTTGTDWGLTAGIGGGWRFGRLGSIEAEFAGIEKKLSLLSISWLYPF